VQSVDLRVVVACVVQCAGVWCSSVQWRLILGVKCSVQCVGDSCNLKKLDLPLLHYTVWGVSGCVGVVYATPYTKRCGWMWV
jgi:hypothetical protein